MAETVKRILVVDDDGDTQFMLSALFEQAGYEARAASAVSDALELARREHFDLFVVDTRLADGTGAALCRQLREAYPHAPVIIFSGALLESEREDGLSAGASEYVAKPGIDGLAEAVRRALGDKKQRS